MANKPRSPWDTEKTALAIILRHRPELAGKTLAEARKIVADEHSDLLKD
jgi:hypothetical protein